MGYDGQNGAVYVFSQVSRTRSQPLGSDEECPPTPSMPASCWKWAQTALLTTPHSAGPQPLLGSSVALSADGKVVLAGAPLDYTAGFQAGAAYVFRVSETDDELGKSVALDGQWFVVGEQVGELPQGDPNTGAVYIYQQLTPPGVMQHEASIVAAEAQQNARFGGAVAINGNTIIVGAKFFDQGGLANAGTAHRGRGAL